MSSPKSFFHWLKKETLASPSNKIDQNILELARAQNATNNPFHFSKYLLATSAIAASLIVLFTSSHLNKINQHPLSESPELLQYYDQVELMNQASELSDQEWDKIIQEDRS
jgi:protein-tyrosine-phosphatase